MWQSYAFLAHDIIDQRHREADSRRRARQAAAKAAPATRSGNSPRVRLERTAARMAGR
jgi:hypothetical protein